MLVKTIAMAKNDFVIVQQNFTNNINALNTIEIPVFMQPVVLRTATLCDVRRAKNSNSPCLSVTWVLSKIIL